MKLFIISLSLFLFGSFVVLGEDAASDFQKAVSSLRAIPGTVDFDVISDISKVVDGANALILQQQQLPDDLRAQNLGLVRTERQRLVRRTAELRGVLDGVRQLRSALQLASSSPSSKELTLRKEAAESSLRVLQFQLDKADSELKAAADKDKPGIVNFIDQQQIQLKKTQADIEDLNEKIKSLNVMSGDIAGTHLAELEIISRRGQSVSTSADYTLNTLDDLAGEMLRTNLFLNSYTNWSTLTFSALVALVIGSFFFITYRAGIGAQILSGDSGIQFVTLFALIIAIILFGVLKILEGKELAALLGGLSGYILGRGTTGANRGIEATIGAGSGIAAGDQRAAGPVAGTAGTGALAGQAGTGSRAGKAGGETLGTAANAGAPARQPGAGAPAGESTPGTLSGQAEPGKLGANTDADKATTRR